MDTIIASVVTGVVAIIVCVINSTYQSNTTRALIEYKIEALEKKQDKHNNVIERMYKVEEKQMVMDFVDKIDLHNTNAVLQYGAATQKKMADFSGKAFGENGSDLLGIHTLTQRPHQLGHGSFRGHIQTLDDTQLQQLIAHLVDPQVGAVIQALGGDDDADAVFHRSADAPQTLAEDIDAAQAEGLNHDALVAHGSQHIKNGRI